MSSANELGLSSDLQLIALEVNPDRAEYEWCSGVALAIHYQREAKRLTIRQLLDLLKDSDYVDSILNPLSNKFELSRERLDQIKDEAANLTLEDLKQQEIGNKCLREVLWLIAEILQFRHARVKPGEPAAVAMLHTANDELVALASS